MDLASDGFGYWLAGLMDGEGSFQITPNRPGFVCRANIGLRRDDAPVLAMVAERTGIGRIVVQARGSSSDGSTARQPLAHWRVERKPECQALVAIFDEFPLRSKKARVYALWRVAVMEMAAMTGNVTTGRGRDWSRVAELKREILDARVYLQHDEVAPGR